MEFAQYDPRFLREAIAPIQNKVGQFQLAAMGRVDQPESERRDFHLLVDEFHNYTTDSFAGALAEARKYRLSLTLAHQYGAQLTDRVRDAVFCNVGTLVVFRVGHADAERLSRVAMRASEYIARMSVSMLPLSTQVLWRPIRTGFSRTPSRLLA